MVVVASSTSLLRSLSSKRLPLYGRDPFVEGGVWGSYAPQTQNARLNKGRKMGMLIANIPIIVSRTPQRLMLEAEGLASTEYFTRMMAAAMTKRPDERTRPITIFFRIGILSLHSMGIGMARTAASVRMLSTATTMKFCIRKLHLDGGIGTTCQFI